MIKGDDDNDFQESMRKGSLSVDRRELQEGDVGSNAT